MKGAWPSTSSSSVFWSPSSESSSSSSSGSASGRPRSTSSASSACSTSSGSSGESEVAGVAKKSGEAVGGASTVRGVATFSAGELGVEEVIEAERTVRPAGGRRGASAGGSHEVLPVSGPWWGLSAECGGEPLALRSCRTAPTTLALRHDVPGGRRRLTGFTHRLTDCRRPCPRARAT